MLGIGCEGCPLAGSINGWCCPYPRDPSPSLWLRFPLQIPHSAQLGGGSQLGDTGGCSVYPPYPSTAPGLGLDLSWGGETGTNVPTARVGAAKAHVPRMERCPLLRHSDLRGCTECIRDYLCVYLSNADIMGWHMYLYGVCSVCATHMAQPERGTCTYVMAIVCGMYL